MKSLEEELLEVIKRFARLSSLIARKDAGETCGEDHEWQKVSMDCGVETLRCLVCNKESVTDYEEP